MSSFFSFNGFREYFILLFQVRSNDLGTEERKATEVLLVSLRPTKVGRHSRWFKKI